MNEKAPCSGVTEQVISSSGSRSDNESVVCYEKNENIIKADSATPELSASSRSTEPDPPPDGGYGWVIVLVAFFISVVVGGNCFSFGVFYPVYIDEFNGSQGSVAWIGSIAACLVVGPGPITGALADRFNNKYTILGGAVLVGGAYVLASFSTDLWHLYVTQGFLAGIGFSLCFMSGISAVGQWFTKNRGLAQGFMVAGSGIGQLVVSMIANTLIQRGGWRFALRILAVLNFSVLLLSSFIVRRWLPCTTVLSLATAWEKFRDHNFCLLFAGTFVNSLGTYMPFTHLTVFALNHGMTKNQAVLILSLVGVANAVGRIVTGWLADRLGKVFMFQVSMFGSGVSTLCWMVCTSFPKLLTYGLVYGFFAGGVISLIPSVTSELFGIKKIGAVTGLLYSSTAVGNLLAAPIGGFLHDAYHSYYPPISVAGGFLLAGIIFIYFINAQTAEVEGLGRTTSDKVETSIPTATTDAELKLVVGDCESKI